jgi:CubicO group peptidase (beta-lactamase class C family)
MPSPRRHVGRGRARGRRSHGRFATALLVPALAIGCSSSTTDARPSPTTAPSAGGSTELTTRSDDLLRRTLVDDQPGCSAAVGVQGQVVWAGARGLADVGTGATIDERTTFHVGSVTKQFTATAALLLAQDGRLRIDDPVARWIPDLPPWSEEVTLAQLMHHTSGLPDFVEPLVEAGSDVDQRVTQQDVLAFLAEQEPTYPPGARAEYSNSGYVLLAEVVLAASGQSLPAFLDDRVFGRLELDMAIDPGATVPDEDDPRTARGHQRDDTGTSWEPSGTRWEMVGPGFLQTTPSELVRWADNYRTGRVGGEELLEAQLADAVPAGPGGYGAGIVLFADGGLWHGGEWAGQIADFSVSPDRSVSVAVACNSFAGSTTDLEHIASNLRALWFD